MNPLNLFRRSAHRTNAQQAHMTWASSSIARSVSRTGIFLKKQIWIWPIIAVLLLSIVGFAVRNAIEG